MKKLLSSMLLFPALAFTIAITAAPSKASAAAASCGKIFSHSKPKLFIMSAPSGAGKTTLINKLLAEYPDKFAVSISTTTRGPRPGEVNGKDYMFSTVDDFKAKIKAGDFIEWAEVHGNYYGTSRSQIEKYMNEGKIVFLNINVDGADTIRKAFPSGIAEGIFISPPSFEILEQRLRARGTETEANIQKRLSAVKDEMKHVDKFESVIVNDDLETAYAELKALVLH